MAIYDYNGNEITMTVSSITERDYYCSFALFEKIGILGDSYARGYSGDDPSMAKGYDHPAVSWPEQLARRQGIQVANYSHGGQSTRTFLSNHYTGCGIDALEADSVCGLYILALERNDYNIQNGGEAGYIGSIADITGHSLGSYPDTFYGNYATIIERVMTHAPKARIVMMVGDYSPNSNGHQFNVAMKEIAEHYLIPYMEQRSDPYFLGDSAYYRNFPPAGHPAPYAYSGMELAIERIFMNCVKKSVLDNSCYFKDYFLYYTGVGS